MQLSKNPDGRKNISLTCEVFPGPHFFHAKHGIAGQARFARKIRQPRFFSIYFLRLHIAFIAFLMLFCIHTTSVAFLMLFLLVSPLPLCVFIKKATRQPFHALPLKSDPSSVSRLCYKHPSDFSHYAPVRCLTLAYRACRHFSKGQAVRG